MYRIIYSAMAYDQGKSGISNYINNTVKELSRHHHLTVIILERDLVDFPVKNDNIQFVPINDSLSSPLKNMLWHLFVLPFKLKHYDYDFIFLPAGNRRLFCYYPSFTISTVHDLSQFHVSAKYDLFRMFYIKKLVPFFLKKIHRITAISQSTLEDLKFYYGIDETKISIAYNGFDSETFSMDNVPADNADFLKTTFSQSKPYILYISRIEHPGKNHLNLIKAFELLEPALQQKYDLVLTGSFWPGSEVVKAYADASACKDSIKFLGFVPSEQLINLYHGAALYVFPSLYEGFGLSLLEAMACGIPVLCSNCSSLPEVGGDAVLSFNPSEPSDIATQITQILSDSQLKESMIAKGFQRTKQFSWEKHCSKIIEIYETNT